MDDKARNVMHAVWELIDVVLTIRQPPEDTIEPSARVTADRHWVLKTDKSLVK